MAMLDENEQSLATEVALVKQAVGNMGSDVTDIRTDLKDLKNDLKHLYYTKEQAANLRSELVTAHNNLTARVDKWEARWQKFWNGVTVGVIVIVVATLILSAFKLKGSAGI